MRLLPLILAAALFGCPEDEPTTSQDTSSSDVTVTTDASGDTAPTPDAGEDTPSTPDAGEDTPSTPDAGEDTPSTPDAGEDTPSTPDAVEDTPSTPDAVEDTGPAPDAGEDTAPTPDAAGDTAADVPATDDGTCEAPLALSEGTPVTGDTSAGADNLTATTLSFQGNCQTGGAPELVYSYTPSVSGLATFNLTVSSGDLGLYIRKGCADGSSELGCADASPGDESLAAFVTAGTSYFVVVDGYSAGQAGSFTLSVDTPATEECQNGVDDNGDGALVDCTDPSCFDNAGCIDAQTTACEAATALTIGTPQAGDNTSGSADFGSFDPVCTALGGAKADIYSYAGATDSDKILAIEVSAATDMGIFARATCGDVSTQAGCKDWADETVSESFSVPAPVGVAMSVFVAAYQAGQEGPYTVNSTEVLNAETEPNDTFETADPVADGDYAHLTAGDDEDWFIFTLSADALSVTFSTADLVAGDCANGRIDPELTVFQSDGVTEVGFSDDIDANTGNFCASVTTGALTAGDYVIRVRSDEAFCPNCATMGYQMAIAVAVE